jgi:hypothetical protein
MNLRGSRDNRPVVQAPKKYTCHINEGTMRCDLSKQIVIKTVDDGHLLNFCRKNPDAKILVLYPRGHTDNKKFLPVFQKHAEILFSETFDITRPQLNQLLYNLYYHSTKLSTDEAIAEKCRKTWADSGQLTIYVFQLYKNCTCLHPKLTLGGFTDHPAKYTKETEREHLKSMKKEIRSKFGTMHALHTSDDHEETMDFAKRIFNDSFLI